MHETILDPLEVPTLKPNHIRQTTLPGSPINIIGRTYVTTLKNINKHLHFDKVWKYSHERASGNHGEMLTYDLNKHLLVTTTACVFL